MFSIKTITSPLKGKLIRLDVNGDLLQSNEHALKVCWSKTWVLRRAEMMQADRCAQRICPPHNPSRAPVQALSQSVQPDTFEVYA